MYAVTQHIQETALVDTVRRIERPHETVHEYERYQMHRQVTNRVEVFLTQWIEDHVGQLRALPEQRLRRVQSPEWFDKHYRPRLLALEARMDEEESLRTLHNMPLLDLYRLDRSFFKHDGAVETRLLLRGSAPDARITSVEKGLDLPEGVEVNPAGKRAGLYMLDEAAVRMHNDSEKLFVNATFDLGGDGKTLVKQRYLLDFVMSHPKYGTQCAGAMLEHVVEPLVQQRMLEFREAAPKLAQLVESRPGLLEAQFPVPRLLVSGAPR